MIQHTSRRDFLALLSMLPVSGLAPARVRPAEDARSPHSATGEGLPVVGLGSSKVVSGDRHQGEEPLRTGPADPRRARRKSR